MWPQFRDVLQKYDSTRMSATACVQWLLSVMWSIRTSVTLKNTMLLHKLFNTKVIQPTQFNLIKFTIDEMYNWCRQLNYSLWVKIIVWLEQSILMQNSECDPVWITMIWPSSVFLDNIGEKTMLPHTSLNSSRYSTQCWLSCTILSKCILLDNTRHTCTQCLP